ncbi:MAG: helix-turn-helix domain-containing protein [Sphaerochaetaceae bacterium]|nr:helix-turn-helix domain-containing protein [Sphaerochaetaceae bacterium]
MKETFYTVGQVSQMLSIHPKTIQRYIREGKLKAIKIGKSWRIGGHELSCFTEGTGHTETDTPTAAGPVHTRVSVVADIDAGEKERAIHILNSVTALMNARPMDSGTCTMHAQILEPEMSVRITIWGDIAPVSVILQSLSIYSEQ